MLSNKTPSGTLRAPGMFEANFARERIVDMLADKLGLDPAELRRRNLIRSDEMPWHVGTESVQPPDNFRQRRLSGVFRTGGGGLWLGQAAGASARGRSGVAAGMAALVEPSGLGPFESARIEIDP